MRISVEVYGKLKDTSAVGPEARDYQANRGSSMRDLLTKLNIWEPDIKRILRNGERVQLDSKIRPYDRVEVY